MQYGCIAEHLGHSFSARIHRELGDYPYELCELAPDTLGAFMNAHDFCGINVTIPYKEAVIPYLHALDAGAEAIGAVNTVVNRAGKLYGYNTDFYGLSALIARIGLDLCGKKVAILGTGGTSRTAAAVARAAKAKTVLRVSRQTKAGTCTYEELCRDHADTEILINTTPVGMYPRLEGTPVALSHFPQLAGVVDAVYNPLRSKLILEAKKRGIPAEGGLYMLVAQAVRASELFFDKAYPADTVTRVFETLQREMQSIVLVGMPASGKSTVGAHLARSMGRSFLDIDAMIVERAGKSIPAIFSEEGEMAFRDLESAVIRETIAPGTGLVIATGGGAILREENVEALRQNGRLYFLDRPLEALLPTEDRPLASSAEAIRALYAVREPIYRACADACIPGAGSVEEVANLIEQEWNT